MIQSKTNSKYWVADYGKTFIRKADNFNMGEEICIGVLDSIENYDERNIEQINK